MDCLLPFEPCTLGFEHHLEHWCVCVCVCVCVCGYFMFVLSCVGRCQPRPRVPPNIGKRHSEPRKAGGRRRIRKRMIAVYSSPKSHVLINCFPSSGNLAAFLSKKCRVERNGFFVCFSVFQGTQMHYLIVSLKICACILFPTQLAISYWLCRAEIKDYTNQWRKPRKKKLSMHLEEALTIQLVILSL
jgi:hypothetical protein